ncbi:MAG: GTP-binding protein [Lachnospiraceae bacterium]
MKTKLFVLTGFLGSGKTTLLTHLLTQMDVSKVGVIQNEFGKLGIDGRILRDDTIKMVEINRGSIFCSCLKLSFIEALGELAKMNLEYVFVESSGLGDPSNVEEILSAVKVLSGEVYEFSGVICLVDGVNFFEQAQDLETVNRQLKHCHLALINKTDLIYEEQIKDLEEEIRSINPACRIERCKNGNLDFSILQEDLLKYAWAEGEDTTNNAENKPKTISLSCKDRVEKEKLIQVLNLIKKDTYRIKGFFLLADGWNQVDVVGSKIDFKLCDKKEESQLVFISKIGPEIIKKVFESWTSTMEEKMELKN